MSFLYAMEYFEKVLNDYRHEQLNLRDLDLVKFEKEFYPKVNPIQLYDDVLEDIILNTKDIREGSILP